MQEMLVRSIGMFITSVGVLILLNPKIAKRMMSYWHKGKNIYLGGLIRILLGVIFLCYTSQAKLPQVMFVLGILAFLGGLLIFIWGLEKANAILDWWDKKPEYSLRLLSLLVIVFGALIIYSA
jgi:protein-S-isoprenylcysteine O-methyltransferase Ste14